MNAKKAGRTLNCSKDDARQRLEDAKAFLVTAETADNDDVIATNAIHAAIAAADVLCCLALGERSNDGNHSAAAGVLRRVDPQLGNILRRCLDLKSKAAYESRDVSTKDAAGTVRQAETLVQAAEKALLAAP